jgi:hypothetical protein
MIRGSGQANYLPTSRVVTVETRLAPPGTRVLAASFRKDGTRYRPGERLEKQARKWAASSAGGREVNVEPFTWSRADAKATLARLMEAMVV